MQSKAKQSKAKVGGWIAMVMMVVVVMVVVVMMMMMKKTQPSPTSIHRSIGLFFFAQTTGTGILVT